MARRRREAAPDAPAGGDAPAAVEGAEPQATLTVRGSADAVKKQLGVGTEGAKPEPEKPKAGNGHEDEKQKFVDALRNPRYVVRIRRQSPRAMAGHLWDQECPITYTKLQDETREGWGGGTYKVVIADPESSRTVAGDTFEIPGDPVAPESEMSAEEQQKLFMQGGPKTPAEMTVDGLNRRAEVTAKMLEVESLEAQLEDARKRREGANKTAPAQDNTRIEQLERNLLEAKHRAEIEARDRKHDEEMRELKAMIAQNAQPKKAEGDSMMMMLMEQMREDRKVQQAQFTALLTQMKDDKLNAVLEEVKSIRNKPAQQGGSLLEQAEAMLKMKKIFGWGEGDDDDDEADDPNDDRPWWERALDKLGGKLGEKLFDKFTSMEDKGEKVDKKKFMEEMAAYADEVAAQAADKARRSLPAAGATPQLPPPPPQTPSAAARPTIPPPPPAPAPATALPPPPPPAPADAAPAPAAAPVAVAEMPSRLTVEQEIALRVGGVLEMIDREMDLRPNQYVWNYEGAYNSLPETILEAVCAAADPVAMLDAFAIAGISAESLAGMKAKIGANPRILAWLKMGHDELKLWWAEKLKDPRYDPFAEEEGEEN